MIFINNKMYNSSVLLNFGAIIYKMTTKYFNTIILLLCFIFIMGCKKNKTQETELVKDNTVIEKSGGELTFKFKNQVEGIDLQLSNGAQKKWYKNQNNDSFFVTKFNYYFTNIKLTADDGSVYEETYSYHLIRHENDSSLTFKVKNIPNKNYVSMSYMIGVDSAKNKSGANTGDLSPDYAMHWGWLSGYIFLKFEGKFIDSSRTMNDVIYHIGGYEGKFKALRTNSISFSNGLLVNSNSKVLTLSANVNELFKNPETINLSQLSFAMTPSIYTVKIANNYIDMFQLVSIE
jgi:hypothetical protein